MIKSWFSRITERTMAQSAVVLIIAVISSAGLAACSDLAGEAGSRSNVDYQKAVERPWPFGPEFNPQ
jgi:hypothetical protein